ncbi:MAG: right-handed parallel beta-helix repeat-containing protein [Bacteroidetes bacterium]|nr:right-handed parallel beta-helix repeat-containing protein [Bacteroidota bacterium]
MSKYLKIRSLTTGYTFTPGPYIVPEGEGIVVSGSDFIIDGNGASFVSQFDQNEPLPVNKKVFSAGGLIVPGIHYLHSKRFEPEKVFPFVGDAEIICSVQFSYLGDIDALSFFLKERDCDELRKVDNFRQVENGNFPRYTGELSITKIQNQFSFVLQVTVGNNERVIVDDITVTAADGTILWEADPDDHLGNCYNIGFSIYNPAKYTEYRGTAIRMENCRNITLRNFSAKGFSTGLIMKNCENCTIEGNDFSENYNDTEYGWGDGIVEYGGIILKDSHHNILLSNRADKVWNGLSLTRSNGNFVRNNTMSYCSNVCLKMSNACDNAIEDNNFSWGLRIYSGEVHARDSVSCLMENGSNRNVISRNDFSYGGDGIFIRVLNHWCSIDNRFIDNNCSHANNNAIEAWSPRNYYEGNNASDSSYGFWLGGSDETVLLNNIVNKNGGAFQNAPEHFGNAGISVVNGSAEGIIMRSNELRDNHGPGFALGCEAPMRSAHWLIVNNRIHSTRNDDRGYRGNAFYLYKSEHIDIINNLLQNIAGSDLVTGQGVSHIEYQSNADSDAGELLPDPTILAHSNWTQGETINLAVEGAEEDPRWFVDGKEYCGYEAKFILDEPRFYRAFFHARKQLGWHNFYLLPAGRYITAEGAKEGFYRGVTGISGEADFYRAVCNSAEITIDLKWESEISFSKNSFGIFVLFNHEAELSGKGRQLTFVFHSENGDATFKMQYPAQGGFVRSDQRYEFSFFSMLGTNEYPEVSRTESFNPSQVEGVSITAKADNAGMGELILDYPVVCAISEDCN